MDHFCDALYRQQTQFTLFNQSCRWWCAICQFKETNHRRDSHDCSMMTLGIKQLKLYWICRHLLYLFVYHFGIQLVMTRYIEISIRFDIDISNRIELSKKISNFSIYQGIKKI